MHYDGHSPSIKKILILVLVAIYNNFDRPTCHKYLIYRLLILHISQILKSLQLVH